MTQTIRQQRIRQLVRRVNRERKQQARQIDILCNDLIGAQREFIQRLGHLQFAAAYYKSILGITDISVLFEKTGERLQTLLPETHIVFCRPDYEPWCYHTEHRGPALGDLNLEQYLDDTVIASVSRSNRSCDTDELLAFGLQVNPCVLSACHVVTLPITTQGRALGFILLYRHGQGFPAAVLKPAGVLADGLGSALAASCTSHAD